MCVEEEVLAAIRASKDRQKYKITPSFFTHLSWCNGYRADRELTLFFIGIMMLINGGNNFILFTPCIYCQKLKLDFTFLYSTNSLLNQLNQHQLNQLNSHLHYFNSHHPKNPRSRLTAITDFKSIQTPYKLHTIYSTYSHKKLQSCLNIHLCTLSYTQAHTHTNTYTTILPYMHMHR